MAYISLIGGNAPTALKPMTVLTQLFDAPQIRYDYFDARPQPGTDEFGKTVLRTLLQFFKDSYLHTLAIAQEDAIENDHDGLLIVEAFQLGAMMHLQNQVDNALAEHIFEAAEAAKDQINEFIFGTLTEEKLVLWTQDESQVVLNLETVTEILNG